MKRTFVLLALLASSSVFANDVDPFGFEKQTFVGGKSFSEVRAETLAAAKNGEIQYGEVGVVKAVEPSFAKSRQQVKAELAVARANGETNYGETYDPLHAAIQHSAQIQ